MGAQTNLYGNDLFGEPITKSLGGKIADRFLLPPFSVLNAREGFWQERKAAWLAMGIRGETGRNALAGGSGTSKSSCYMVKKQDGTTTTSGDAHLDGDANCSSVFDPVLCELSYRWFCPPASQVVDPFAGGSVRGIVAHSLGRKYWGCDLRQEQIDANNAQAAAILPDNRPSWVCGDSSVAIQSAPPADLIFSCPPYGDLEKYSDDPRDLSAMDYGAFMDAYSRIIEGCFAKLLPDRFAVFVVGDFRDGKGNLRNFVGHTVSQFKASGFEFYNEAILVTSCGSLPLRIGRQFSAGRKLGKSHQNVLVFLKGDAKRACAACGSIDIA